MTKIQALPEVGNPSITFDLVQDDGNGEYYLRRVSSGVTAMSLEIKPEAKTDTPFFWLFL